MNKLDRILFNIGVWCMSLIFITCVSYALILMIDYFITGLIRIAQSF